MSYNLPGVVPKRRMQSDVKLPTLAMLSLIALLAIVSYLPTLTQPFIEDDFPNIAQARVYGPITGWATMAQDDIHRVRATTFVLTHWIERSFGLKPAAFYAMSILLHVLNCWLVYALGRWQVIGFRVSAWAAVYFAIYEGHQEAIMWYSACNELLLFLFGVLSLLSWINFLAQGQRRWRWYVCALVFFTFALLSKESSFIIVPLLFLPVITSGSQRQRLLLLLPFIVLGAVYALTIFQTQDHSFRFHDQSFELRAPFWETWSKSFFALFWPWGWLAVMVLFVYRQSERLLGVALCWISLSFVPYMFVAYIHRVPSRQTYLASAGLALIVGAAVVAFRERIQPSKRWLTASVLGVVLLHNVAYLWTRKHEQFLKRAEPTEQLIAFVGNSASPVFVRCFPRPPIIGDAAVQVTLGKPNGTLIWSEAEAERVKPSSTFCYEAK